MNAALLQRMMGAAALCFALGACAANAGATPTPPPTQALPTARPTLTPRPTATLAPSSSLPVLREPEPTATPATYVVQPGDTLIPIANQFGISVADLLAANPGLDASRLQIGQKIVIPAAGVSGLRPAQTGALLPSPTPAPFSIRGLNVYRTAAGSLECLGEVLNPGPTALGNVQLQITLQDAASKPIGSATFFVAQEVIPPGQTSPFRVLFTDPPPNFDKYTLRALRGEVVDAAARFARISVSKPQGGATEGSQYRVTGELLNVDRVAAKTVRVIVTTYDKDKRVIGFRYVDASDQPLAPNATLPFTATLLSAGTVADFGISVEGLR